MPADGSKRPTQRQQDVLEMLTAGLEDKQIAAELGISIGGVRKHLERLRQRYRASNRIGLVRAAVLAGDIRFREPRTPESASVRTRTRSREAL